MQIHNPDCGSKIWITGTPDHGPASPEPLLSLVGLIYRYSTVCLFKIPKSFKKNCRISYGNLRYSTLWKVLALLVPGWPIFSLLVPVLALLDSSLSILSLLLLAWSVLALLVSGWLIHIIASAWYLFGLYWRC